MADYGTLTVYRSIPALPTFAGVTAPTSLTMLEASFTDIDTGMVVTFDGSMLNSGAAICYTFQLRNGANEVLAEATFGVNPFPLFLATLASGDHAAALDMLFAELSVIDLSNATEPVVFASLKDDITIIAPPDLGLPGDDAVVAILHSGITLQVDDASSTTVTGPVDSLIFDAAGSVHFALSDLDTTDHLLLPGLVLESNVPGASISFEQTHAGATNWAINDWTATGEPVAITIDTYDGAFADSIYVAATANAGNLVINTYGGNDTIHGAYGDHVTIDAGAGIDLIHLGGDFERSAPFVFDLNAPDWAVFGLDSVSNVERIWFNGGAGGDTLTGGAYVDLLWGNGGSDLLHGGGGDDALYGGHGNDTLYGDAGDDFIDAGLDNDIVYGGDGDDSLDGGFEDDTLYGGADDDVIRGGDGADSVDGGDGIDMIGFTQGTGTLGVVISLGTGGVDIDGGVYPDLGPDGLAALIGIAGSSTFTLAAGTARDTDGSIDQFTDIESVRGSHNSDFIIGSTSGELLEGAFGEDWIYGEAGNDRLRGEEDSDHLFGGTGDDTLFGGDGNDTLQGGAGNDTIYGDYADGNYSTGDTVVYAGAWLDFTITGTTTLTISSAAEGTDTVTDVEYFTFNGATVAADDIVNHGPVGVDDAATVFEANEIDPIFGAFGNALTNDTDRNSVLGDTKTVTGIRYADSSGGMAAVGSEVTIGGTYGNLTIKADGSYTYRLYSNLPSVLGIAGGGSATETFAYEVTDAHGATDEAEIAITIREINDAPTGANKTITLTEDSAGHTFSAADFGFTDIDHNALHSVIITSLPTAGTLKLNGVTVTLNKVIAASALGGLKFTPAANGNGSNYANIGFKVVDTGGTADGGHNTDDTANTIRFNVTAVNDAPVITSNGGNALAVTISENTTAVTTAKATDVDGTVKYSLTGTDAALFKVSSTGVVTLGAAAGFEAPNDAGRNHVYNLVIVASDGALTDAQKLTVTLKNVLGNTIAGTTRNDTVDATHKIGGKGATAEEDKIDGKAGNDKLGGSGGNDTLIGGVGKDSLTGGSGADKFVFNATLSRTTNVDTITDFSHAQGDKIQLDNAVMAALGSKIGSLGSQFYAASGAVNGKDSNDHIIYNTKTGALYYDSNGSGAGGVTQIALLTTKPTLVAADFEII